MNGWVKKGAQIAFLVLLIWVLAAFVGAAPGASVRGPGFAARIGPRTGRRGRGCWWQKRNRTPWASPGMVGEFCDTGATLGGVGWYKGAA
jgi:hypothetical protein